VAAAVFAFGALGGIYLFEGFDLSRDEFMAVYDAKIFGSGRLFASLPLEWRPFADALQPQFMAPLKGGEQMVSGYLPVNAMLRAGWSMALHMRSGRRVRTQPLSSSFCWRPRPSCSSCRRRATR
jgi:hypothetical protein